jgi:DNA-binding MarR family transcriptional regulator
LASAGTISFHRGIGKIDREGPAPVTPESKIFPVARKVLNAIQAGEWVTVGVMTDRTGINRNSVNPSLKILADAGYLEREQRPDPIRVTWFYRLTSKGEANKS